MNHHLLRQRFLARICPRRRTARLQRNETRGVFTGFDRYGRLGGGNFSLKFCDLRMGHMQRAAPDEERRRQRETSQGDQDGRTVWYAP